MPLPRRSWAQLVVVDSREVDVLRPHRTNTPEQQPPPTKRSLDRKDPTRRHMNKDKQRPGPSDPPKTTADQISRDPPETHLHTPSDDARHTIGAEARRGESYSIFKKPTLLIFYSRKQTLTKLEEAPEIGAPSSARAEIHRSPMALRPQQIWEIGRAAHGRQKP